MMTKLPSTLFNLYKTARSSKLVGYLIISLFVVATLSWGLHYGDPEEKCRTSPLEEVWSSDRAYKATLLKQSCNQDESVIYKVRLDSLGSSTTRRWFIPGYELENDEYPKEIPKLRWVKPRQLEAIVRTRTLSGTLTVHQGDDLVFIRTYAPAEPAAFPNY